MMLPNSDTHQIEFKNPVFDSTKPRNVVDYMKWMQTDQIIQELEGKKKNFGILLVNIDYDNNAGNIIRSANAFGAQEIILYGRRKFDRRASLGVEFYMQFRQIKFVEDIDEVLASYDQIIGLDNLPGALSLPDYQWNHNIRTLICVGQEGLGLPDEVIKKCHSLLEIPQVGSVRSLNVSVASGIVMYDYCYKRI
jgi:tRNA G18 (ribose-2'-O)-methylase SpoU